MICPKCGFEQPDSAECMRCGIIVSRYKGPVAGAGPRNTPPAFAPGAPPQPPPPPFMPPPPVIAGGAVHAPVPPPPVISPDGTVLSGSPASPVGGTVYGGPPPPPAGSGAVYGGPGRVAPAFSSFGGGFHGTFEVGKTLSEAFSIYFSNFIPFLLLSAIISAPVFALAAYVSTLKSTPGVALTFYFLALLLMLICSQVTAAGITYGTYQQIRGKDVSMVDCLQVGLSLLFPVLGVATLTSVAEFAGFALCIAPGVLIALRLPVVVPVTVEERPGVFEAMRRSAYLTEGYRGQVFGVLFVVGLITQVAVRLALIPFHDLGSLLMVTSFVNILTTGLVSTTVAVMYYRLRSVKEGIDVDQISSVFA
ncbi:MAG TPA: hypothetical protein VLX28_12495 [Thermoanaerobaculia bacterium]|nr:hypothetical protein [Thermoanaerobaculia bacterium]